MADNTDGAIQIGNDVLADIAGYAALECYGIVGMAAPTLRDGVAQLLSLDKLRRGVRVNSDGEGVSRWGGRGSSTGTPSRTSQTSYTPSANRNARSSIETAASAC